MFGLLAAAALGAAPCELHLFALDLGGGPPRAGNLFIKVLPPSDDPLAFINVMSPQDRMMQVDDGEYRKALGLADGISVVRHWDMPVNANVRKATAPLVPTPGRCHIELVGYTSLGVPANRNPDGKDAFRISFLLREFNADGQPVFQFDKGVPGEVDTEKKVGRESALASLQAASSKMIDDFGVQYSRQRDKKPHEDEDKR